MVPVLVIRIRKPPVIRVEGGERVTADRIVIGERRGRLFGGFVTDRYVPGFSPQVIEREDGELSFIHPAKVRVIDLRAGVLSFSEAKLSVIAIRSRTLVNNVRSGRVEELTDWRVLRANSNTLANGNLKLSFLTWPRGTFHHEDVPGYPPLTYPSPNDGKFEVEYLVEDEEVIREVGGFAVEVIRAPSDSGG